MVGRWSLSIRFTDDMVLLLAKSERTINTMLADLNALCDKYGTKITIQDRIGRSRTG